MKRSKFSLSTELPFTANMGGLYPINVTEVLPADTVQQHSKVLVRFSPLAAPVMHRATVRIHHFYCSSLNLAKQYTKEEPGTPFDWELFITGGPDNDDTQTVPTVALDGVKGNIPDYMGLPASDSGRSFDVTGNNVNALPFVMYNFVVNEYFRDQDLGALRDWDDMTVANIAWAKDWATTMRETPQRGTQVTLPLGDRATVKIGPSISGTDVDDNSLVIGNDGTPVSHFYYDADDPPDSGTAFPSSSTAGVYADLANATGIDPIEFRRAMALQTWAEIRQKYGARYVEYMRYLGGKLFNPPDRPVYLGGGVSPVQFSEVLQTALDSGSGVGDMYGHGISLMRGNRYRRTFDEHGYIMTFLSVRPRAVYQDGIAPMWLRQDKEDFFTRELELIGMQPVPIECVYADPGTPGETMGWQDNYYDYREGWSSVAGDFNDTLDYWHMSRQFSAEPALNETFIKCDPTTRIFQSAAADTLWCLAHNSIVARRNVRKNPRARII